MIVFLFQAVVVAVVAVVAKVKVVAVALQEEEAAVILRSCFEALIAGRAAATSMVKAMPVHFLWTIRSIL